MLKKPPLGVQLAKRIRGPVKVVLRQADKERLEGIVLKPSTSTYLARRRREWLELKRNHADEIVMIGYAPHSASGDRIGACRCHPGERTPYFRRQRGDRLHKRYRAELFTLLQPFCVGRAAVTNAPAWREAVWVTPRYVAENELAI